MKMQGCILTIKGNFRQPNNLKAPFGKKWDMLVKSWQCKLGSIFRLWLGVVVPCRCWNKHKRDISKSNVSDLSRRFPNSTHHQHNTQLCLNVPNTEDCAKYSRYLPYLAHWVTNNSDDGISGLNQTFQNVILKGSIASGRCWEMFVGIVHFHFWSKCNKIL